MKIGQVRGDELFVRCPYCGDSSKSTWKAHLSINLTSGMYHCFLCQTSGKLTPQVLFELQMEGYPQLSLNWRNSRPGQPGSAESLPVVLAGPGTERRSLLDRYHTPEGHDIFRSWWKDQHVGYYMRAPQLKRLWGFSGTCWYQAPNPLVSTPEDPLRFVEGPYDVLDDRTVCFFGIPTYIKIKQFYREHYFNLVPDGDLWTSPAKFAILEGLIERLVSENFGFLGVEFIPQNFDPDFGKTKFIPVQFFKDKLWKRNSLSSKARLVLESLHSSVNLPRWA